MVTSGHVCMKRPTTESHNKLLKEVLNERWHFLCACSAQSANYA